MRNDDNVGRDTGRARILGTILLIVAGTALAMRAVEWLREGRLSHSGLALPLGAMVLALAHLLAPGNQRAYQLASALFVAVIIADLLLSALVR